MLARLKLDGARVILTERLLADFSERIADVRQGPHGLRYLLGGADEGRLVRINPSD